MKVSVNCNNKTVWFVTDSYGRTVIPETNIPTPTEQSIIINGSNWSAGIYYLTIKQEKKTRQYKLVKLCD
jgi:hypothetical protein